jgi:Radical SAM superfamily
MTESVVVSLEEANGTRRVVDGTRVCFSVYRCFAAIDDECRPLLRQLAEYLDNQPGLALWNGPLLAPLLEAAPDLSSKVRVVIGGQEGSAPRKIAGITAVSVDALPETIKTVFICEIGAVERMAAADALPKSVNIADAEVLGSIALETIPGRAWTPIAKNIYPIRLPSIRFSGKADLLLIDCPARNLALMPNGLGYVHNALKKAGINFETFDLDIVTYHRYHIGRLFDEGGKVVLPSGREMPTDPWQAENYDLWDNPELLAYLSPIIDEATAAIVKAKPKVLGLSIQQCNTAFSHLLVKKVKDALPDVLLLVGGFSCYNPDIGLRAFAEADYMCIGESDLTVGPLVKRLVAGERPKDLPGVLSRFDTPDRLFVPAPMQHNLDQLDFPHYEWFDLDIYRNFNGYQLVPIIASRGCRWSRCTFCAERFYWRIRSSQNFVNELEWLVNHGCTLFMFNESDLNGMPEKLLEICDEIIRRDIKVRLTGQLRIQKTSDGPFYRKLREAGFVALRFGVDAFSENTLRLQKKGYTVEMIRQNLKECWEAGIFTEVNWVIGVPGETDADCEEGVNLILENQQYIGRLANINPLILVNGSVYWIDPERHGICFRTSKEELYANNPRYVPADSWYSINPYIDAQVRKQRFENIVLRLYETGFKVGPWAERVIADVKEARDRARAGGAYKPEVVEVDNRPTLVQTLPTHKVWLYKNRYYAVPLALGDVDLKDPASADLPGVLSADNETVLLVELEHSKSWANSRGQYDAQERQRIAGSLYRAGSALGDERQEKTVAPQAVIIPLNGEYIALQRDQLDAPATADATSVAPALARSPRQGSPLHRRLAMVILGRENIRSLWPSRRGPVAWTERESRAPALESTTNVATTSKANDLVVSNSTRLPVPNTELFAIRAITKGAQPTMLAALKECEYNLVEYDGLFYGLPYGLAYDWENPCAASLPDVIIAESAGKAMRMIRGRAQASATTRSVIEAKKGSGPAGEITKVPQLLGAIEDYNIVSYEGFIYGLPQALGPIDLTVTDTIEIKGVIRDVSQQVVENEIRELVAIRRQAAE